MRSARLVSILLNLQLRGRLTARELAERLEVSERTIYRDLEALGLAGVPVYADRGPNGGFSLVDGYRTQLTGLTSEEASALFALGVPGPLTELGLAAPLVGAQLKLLAALPPQVREVAERMANRFHIDSTRWFRSVEDVPHLPLLQAAVWSERRVSAVYSTRENEEVRRKLEPVALVLKGVLWYLVAGSNRQIAYRVSRFREIQLLDETFERPRAFDLASFWSSWSEEFEQSRPRFPVEVRVSRGLLAALPQIFGDAARPAVAEARPETDGWMRVTLSFESMEAACGRLLSLGAEAEVIEPETLRKMIASKAKKVVALYG